nr:activity-dependent neuroprotective protein 2a-like [Nerophis lumbriciformis]XP_061787277.1 activity-dependent neuroprotective protein 2a-like [Nerophis lumbriciformis]XP_061787278.1 activity-dependent neuroprotective protein 2a-like [Nerophis lumbriciformis]XP_061787279.1 activity-dependent neuroprotective protein 2a-like [Nerophis lumbriciformis]
MYQLPVGNLDKIRKARKSVKHVLSEIGLEDCQNFLKEFDQSPEQNSEEADPPKGAEGSDSADAHHNRLQKKDGDDLQGTEWSDFTDGYHGRLQKKWPYRSRTMCCAMCKYSSQNIYHYRNHVARCHECLQTLCALTACHRCIFVAHPRVLKKHLAFFHGNRGVGPLPGEAVHRGNERYQCRKCGFPTHSVFAIKKHIILKHLESYTDQYIGYRYPVSGSAVKLYCCKVCKVNTGTLDQMLHHMLVDPKHFAVNSQVQTMIYENKNFAKPPPNGNGGFVTLPSLAPKPQQSKSFVVPSNGQHGGAMVALNQMQGASNSATLICAPNSNQAFLPPQASALVQLASAEAKGLLQPGATIALRGSSLVQYPNMSLKQAPPQSQQILIPSGPQVNAAAGPGSGSAPRSAMVVQNPPANQMTLQGTMLTSQSLLSHLIPTGNRVNGMPTYTFAPLQMAAPGPQSPAGPAANQTKKWITCPLCNELFPSNVFDMHIEVAHHSKSTVSRSESLAGRAAFLRKMPDKTLKCLTCKVLLSEKSVLQHLLHGLGCLYCATTFFSVKQLNEHVRQHNPSGKLYCDFLRQNYKIYTKPNAGILFPYFDVATTAPREVLGECEVNLALVTSSLELIYVQLQPSSQPEICSAPVRVNATFCPFCDEKFQEESKHLQHLKQKHFVAPTIHAILKTEAFKCVYCNGVYTGKVTQQAVMLHIQRCRSSPKPAKITAPPPPPLPKSVQVARQPSGLYFLQMPVKQMPAKALGPASPAAAGPSPQPSTEQMQSTRRLEAALKEVIAFNKREREHKAAMRKKREQERLMPPPEPEVQSDPNIKLVLEPGALDRRGPDERRNFIARYFNTNPYAGRAETEELCRRLALTKAEVVALFSTKRSRCLKNLKKSSAAVLMGFDMARLAQLKHPLHIPEQRPAELREEEPVEEEEPEEEAESMEEKMAEGGNEKEKMAEEVPMEQNS